MRKVKQSTTVDGKVVHLAGSIAGLDIYHSDLDCDTTLFLADSNGSVVGSIKVEADMGQGCGYVASIEVKS